ncbi:MAG: Ureidoglycolate lyase [Lentisphaerae bacterium ADurb.BinA184]|nr:MAG: Ureidoglycolate lyase [Lentisphaerae bacterium ADurb.BinA184]
MRTVRILHRGRPAYGILEGDRVALLAGPPFERIRRLRTSVPAAEAVWLAPVEPPNVLAIGLNYRRHAAESGKAPPDHPILFIKATTAVVGPGAPIVLPRMAPDEVDYEAELVAVIGRTARHVAAGEAMRYVFGCTCGNDVSARDCQLRLDGQWARGKSFDSFCPLGPWIDTEVCPDDLAVCSRLNGQTMQESRTSDMVFGVADLVAFLSSVMTLLPGTVIMTGTPAGVGWARRPPVFLRPGDTIEVTIEGIGNLVNPVVADDDGGARRSARKPVTT